MNSIDQSSTSANGFILIELVLATALTAGLVSLFLPLSLQGLAREQHNLSSETIIHALRTAQEKALSEVQGIHFAPDGVTLFTGDSYATRVYALDRFIALSPFTYTGADDIIFTPPFGTPTSATIFAITSHRATTTIAISEGGLITGTFTP